MEIEDFRFQIVDCGLNIWHWSFAFGVIRSLCFAVICCKLVEGSNITQFITSKEGRA